MNVKSAEKFAFQSSKLLKYKDYIDINEFSNKKINNYSSICKKVSFFFLFHYFPVQSYLLHIKGKTLTALQPIHHNIIS
jgi:hypothetical protein